MPLASNPLLCSFPGKHNNVHAVLLPTTLSAMVNVFLVSLYLCKSKILQTSPVEGGEYTHTHIYIYVHTVLYSVALQGKILSL